MKYFTGKAGVYRYHKQALNICRLSGICAFHRLINKFEIKRDIITLLKRYTRYLIQIMKVLSEWQIILSTEGKQRGMCYEIKKKSCFFAWC